MILLVLFSLLIGVSLQRLETKKNFGTLKGWNGPP